MDPHPLVINLTSLIAFGVVWISKFFILDRVLFKHEELTDEPLDALGEEVVVSPSAADVSAGTARR